MKDSHIDSLKRLQDIEKAIVSIQKYVATESSDSFCQNEIVHDAVLFQFSVIGEAITYIEDAILEKYNYPWHKARSFRNMIAHEYFNIKFAVVWEIIEHDLPKLNEVIKSILKNELS
jgi:uncharacterized protein with HEPN domain